MKKRIIKIAFVLVPISLIAALLSISTPSRILADTLVSNPGTSSGIGDSGTGCTNTGGNWGSTTNVASSNNAYATFGGNFFDGGEISDELALSNLGFSIPNGSTIDGILVEIERHVSGAGDGAVDQDIRLTKSAGVQTGSNYADTVTEWSTSDPDAYASYGGSSDLWGTTWTEAEVESSGFGVVICAKATSNNTDLNIDHVRITIYYTPVASVDLSGTVYQSEGGSVIGAGKTVTVYKNGSTSLGSDTTDSNGAWALTGLNISSGNIVTVYIDGDSTYKGNAVFSSSGTNQTNVDVYGGTLIVRHDTGSSITNANLSTGRVSGDANDMLYTVSGSDITASSSASISIWSADTYAPGGNITLSGSFTNNGTFTAGGGTVTFVGPFTTSVISSTDNMSFNNFTSTASGKTILFKKHTSNTPIFTIAGSFNVSGSNGNPISLKSDTPGSKWLVHFNSAQSGVNHVRITDGGCSGGSATVATKASIINAGNNDSCWGFLPPSAPEPTIDGGNGGGNVQTGGSRKSNKNAIEDSEGGGTVATGGDEGGSVTEASP